MGFRLFVLGPVAHMVEHTFDKHGVVSSILIRPANDEMVQR